VSYRNMQPDESRERAHSSAIDRRPALMTVTEIAAFLRTSTKAIYAMIERAQLPGVVRIGRRVLVREDATDGDAVAN
jgi:excisionase family DNA binding protein